jgi:ketosteroid isomerase-like protein
MTLHSCVLGLSALVFVTLHGGGQPSGAQVGTDRSRAADLAAIEKVRQQEIAATISRDSVALTDYWTDDAIRIGVGAPAEVGKQLIRTSNDRQTANKDFKVLSFTPEVKDFTFLDGGWAVEWRSFTGSFVVSAGGDVQKIQGTVLAVWKKLPDGSWKIFRAMGSTEPVSGK